MPGSKKTYESPRNKEVPVVPIGKESSFDFFFRKYFTALCYFANSLIHNEEEARDIVQECFLRLWDDDIVEEKAAYMQSFLYTSVRHRCIDYIRKQKIRTKAAPQLQSTETDNEYFDEIAFAEMMRLVLQHINNLPAHMQTIMKEHYLLGKKHKEIAVALRTTENAVQLQKSKALKLLKGKLLLFMTNVLYLLLL